MLLNDYNVGDVLILTSRSNQGEENRGAIVTAVNYSNLGLVTYTGYKAEGCELTAGSGAFNPIRVGTTPFGLVVGVQVVGHVPVRVHQFAGPYPGDRGYDLMGRM